MDTLGWIERIGVWLTALAGLYAAVQGWYHSVVCQRDLRATKHRLTRLEHQGQPQGRPPAPPPRDIPL